MLGAGIHAESGLAEMSNTLYGVELDDDQIPISIAAMRLKTSTFRVKAAIQKGRIPGGIRSSRDALSSRQAWYVDRDWLDAQTAVPATEAKP